MKHMMLIVVLGACGSEPVDSDDGSGHARQGYTECGDVTCQPGQYCQEAHVGSCVAGCTSDENCAENQSCEDPDAFNIGTCMKVGAVCGNDECENGESAGNCPDDCGSASQCGDGTCDPGETAATCEDDCSLRGLCDSECFAFDFLGCFDPGDLQDCYDACDDATETQMQQFINCFGSPSCNEDCLEYLP